MRLGSRDLSAIRIRGKGKKLTYSRFYEDSYVALKYGESVDDFLRRAPWTQARMIATVRTADKIEAVIRQEAEAAAK